MTKPTTPLEFVQAFRAKGLTQLQIEERTGIPQSTISKIERGQIHEVRSLKHVALQSLYAELFPEGEWDGGERRANPPCSGKKSGVSE